MGTQYESRKTQEDAVNPKDEQEKMMQKMEPPTQPPAQPPPSSRGKRQRWFIVSALLVVLVLVLALGSVLVVQLTSHPASQPTPTPTTATTPTPASTATTPSPLPPAGAYQPIISLWMSDASTGWARTTTQLILHTTDGGKSWQDVTPQYPAGITVKAPLSFASLSGTIAWVAVFGQQQQDGSVPNVVMRTTDGGHTWQGATLPKGKLGVSQIQFVNPQAGWVLAGLGGEGAGSQMVNLYRSTDGGQTWSLIASSGNSPTSIPTAGHKTGMGWASATTGWITGVIAATTDTMWLYRTQDGGVNWQAQTFTLPDVTGVITTHPPVFFSSTDGLLPITAYNGTKTTLVVGATNDGGETISGSTISGPMLLTIPNTGSVWDFLTMHQWWVVEANGTTLDVTSDGAQHWTVITPSANFQHISQLEFVSAQEGWAISTAKPDKPVMLKTMDGGHTWAQV